MISDDISISPLFEVYMQTIKAVDWAAFLVYGKPSLWVANPLFLFGFEEHLQHIHHAAGIEDCTVFWE